MMTLNLFYIYYFIVSVICSRVVDIGNGFFERNLTETGEKWFIMFYVPWCHYCKRFDPVWSNVAQDLYHYKVHMAKFDCSQFKDVHQKLQIHAYPTFIFFKNNEHYKYNSEVSKTELFQFVRRLSELSFVVDIKNNTHLERVKNANSVFFMYIGSKIDALWLNYFRLAKNYHGEVSFYAIDENHFKNFSEISEPFLVVYKSGKYYYYNNEKSLNEWFDNERFEIFQKVTENSFHQLQKITKLLVLVVVKENEINQLTGNMEFFKNFMESIVLEFRDKYFKYFQFCWVTNPSWIEKILMRSPTLPYFFVMNSSNYQYYFPEKEAHELNPEDVKLFLDHVRNQSLPIYGGISLSNRIYRFLYIAIVTVHEMWKGNPVLTSVVFGIPTMYLLLILYTGFCPDFFEDSDEESDESKFID